MKEEEYKMRYTTTEVFRENLENMPPVRHSNSRGPISQVYCIFIFPNK